MCRYPLLFRLAFASWVPLPMAEWKESTRNPCLRYPRPSSPWNIIGAHRDRSIPFASASSHIWWLGRHCRNRFQNSSRIARSLSAFGFISPTRMCHRLNFTRNSHQDRRLMAWKSPVYLIPGGFASLVNLIGTESKNLSLVTFNKSLSEFFSLIFETSRSPGDFAALSPMSLTTLLAVLMAALQDVASERAEILSFLNDTVYDTTSHEIIWQSYDLTGNYMIPYDVMKSSHVIWCRRICCNMQYMWGPAKEWAQISACPSQTPKPHTRAHMQTHTHTHT